MIATKFMTLAGGLALVALTSTPAIAEDEKPATSVDASKGGFTIKSGDNSLTFGAYTQLRAVIDDREQWDADSAGSGDGLEDGTAASFDVAKVRLSMRGTMWKPWLKYVVAYELSRTSGENSSKVKDAYFDFASNPVATFRVGQFKVPFSLQELSGDQHQQFVDRGLTNAFAPARDTGVMLHGTTAEKSFGYQVGLFNGSGESTRQEDDALMYAARIWFDPLGEYALREGTNDNPDKNVVHVGLGLRGGEIMKGNGGRTGVFEDPDGQTAYNLELAWKLRAFFATGEYFLQTTEFQNPSAAADVDAAGFHVQGGWMAMRDRFELGLRYASLDPNKDIDDDEMTELRGIANWFFKGHNLKIQADLGQLKYDANAPASFNGATARGAAATASAAGRLPAAAGGSVSDLQVRVQFQLNF